MKRIIRLTESDLTRIVRRVIMEQATATTPPKQEKINGITLGSVINKSTDPKLKDLVIDQIVGKYMSVVTSSKLNGGKPQPVIMGEGFLPVNNGQKLKFLFTYYCTSKVGSLSQYIGTELKNSPIEIADSGVLIDNKAALCENHRKYLIATKQLK